MSSAAGPNTSNSGLILEVDVVNPKSYPITVEVLIVAGGGGGGVGGGGAGGLIYNAAYSLTNMTSAVTVGAGGIASTVWGGNGTSGANSIFGSLTAIGGV